MTEFVNVAKTSDIPDQAAKCVEVQGRRICLVNLGGTFYAIDDTCTHA
ncbi:MAG: Rieske 2Fe-2S domain-containing protein, partial [Planctomycetes bacterium]|nr:Rieske 2Fe-2S domain-containing protein [Planctomycetota bacterium]